MEVIRQAADPECSKRLETSVAAIDRVLSLPNLRKHLKGLFGLADLEDDDFANVISVSYY